MNDSITLVFKKCDKCLGSGWVANSKDQEPWNTWTKSYYLQKNITMLAITCPKCNGKGEFQIVNIHISSEKAKELGKSLSSAMLQDAVVYKVDDKCSIIFEIIE